MSNNQQYSSVHEEQPDKLSSIRNGNCEPVGTWLKTKRDLACFLLWERAREREKDILSILEKRFKILGEYEVVWSHENIIDNLSRIYDKNSPQNAGVALAKVGRPPFKFILVEDSQPRYTWTKSVSRMIEPSNSDVISLKEEFRSWFPEKFQVHSSTNMDECLFQSALILGVEQLEATISSEERVVMRLDKDLEGAHGWCSWEHLFRVMNYCGNYLLLSDPQELPEKLDSDTVSFLCDDLSRFMAAANIQGSKKVGERHMLTIIGQKEYGVHTSVVGDGYFDTKWQMNMLARRESNRGFFSPRLDDLFFFILYNALVHKQKVVDGSHTRLSGIAKEMQFGWYESGYACKTLPSFGILRGFMIPNGYCFSKPLDKRIKVNLKARLLLPTESVVPKEPIVARILDRIRRFLLHPKNEKKRVINRVLRHAWSEWLRLCLKN